MFRMVLRRNSDYFSVEQQLTAIHKRDGVFTARYGLNLEI